MAAIAAGLIPAAPALGAGDSGDAELIELGRRYLHMASLEAAAGLRTVLRGIP